MQRSCMGDVPQKRSVGVQHKMWRQKESHRTEGGSQKGIGEERTAPFQKVMAQAHKEKKTRTLNK